MATNRKIKSDGEVHISGTNCDIESTVDITGDVNATGDLGGATATVTGNSTIGGTLGVTGQATLSGLAFPTSDGTSGQALTTDGNGALSFATISSGGADTVASSAEAQAYSGNSKIIQVTSSDSTTLFDDAISDKIILCTTGVMLKFTANVTNCIIQTTGSVNFTNTSGDTTTDVLISNVTVRSGHTISLTLEGEGTGNDLNIVDCDFKCEDMDLTATAAGNYNIERSKIFVAQTLDSNQSTASSSAGIQLDDTFIETGSLSGKYHFTGSKVWHVKVARGLTYPEVKIFSDIVLNGALQPLTSFELTRDGLSAKNYARAGLSSTQTVNSSSLTVIEWDTTTFDTASQFSTSQNRYTARTGGYYKITNNIRGDGFGSTNLAYIEISHYNGSSTVVVSRAYLTDMLTASSSRYVSHSDIVYMAPGNRIQTKIKGDSNYEVNTESFLTIERI